MYYELFKVFKRISHQLFGEPEPSNDRMVALVKHSGLRDSLESAKKIMGLLKKGSLTDGQVNALLIPLMRETAEWFRYQEALIQESSLIRRLRKRLGWLWKGTPALITEKDKQLEHCKRACIEWIGHSKASIQRTLKQCMQKTIAEIEGKLDHFITLGAQELTVELGCLNLDLARIEKSLKALGGLS